MRGPFGFFSKSCSSISNYVQDKVDKAKQKKNTRRNPHQDFLADIDDLNRTIQIRERKEKAGLMRMGKSTKSMAGEAPSDYVSMEEQTAGEQSVENNQQGSKTDTPQDSNQEEDVAFFWELLRFAKNRSWKKKVMTALIVCISMYVIIDLIFLGYIMTLITKFLEWMTEHPAGAVICFLGFFVLATLFFVPPTILYFGAGYAFCDVAGFWGGLVAGIVVCFIGSSLGAILAFLRSRYMMRDLVELFSKRFPIVKCLDEAMRTQGFRAMTLLRLCPIIPFNALNHVGGITQISLEEYTFALIGIIPTIVLWVLVGATTDHIRRTEADDTGEYVFYIALMVGGVLFAVIGLFLLYRYAREELHKEIKAQRALSWHSFADKSSESASQKDLYEGAEEGFELIERHPGGFIAVLGLDHRGTESSSAPQDGSDEDWLWVWA